MLRTALVTLVIASGFSPFASAENDSAKKQKTADDIEIIVESDQLCDPHEEVRMPRYY